MTMKIEQSSGNVFRDVGFGPKEAESLRLRAQLMVEVTRLIQARKLTQRAAANLLGVTQPRISDLIRGKIDLFSITHWSICSPTEEYAFSCESPASTVVGALKPPDNPDTIALGLQLRTVL